MAGRLRDKKVLVTAAAQGIGLAIARACAAEGAEVIASDINEAGLQRELEGVAGVRIRHLDVRDPEAIAHCASDLPALDVLVNVAGFVHHGSILEASEADWNFAFSLNVTAMFHTIRAFLPGMLERRAGSIINMASVASSIRGLPQRCTYGASKAAVIGLTKSVAADYVASGIRCNAICPGTVQSPSLDERIDAFDDPVAARKAFVARQPMGRLGQPEEIAALTVYLASDESAFTTGTTLVVDGGVCL